MGRRRVLDRLSLIIFYCRPDEFIGTGKQTNVCERRYSLTYNIRPERKRLYSQGDTEDADPITW